MPSLMLKVQMQWACQFEVVQCSKPAVKDNALWGKSPLLCSAEHGTEVVVLRCPILAVLIQTVAAGDVLQKF